MARLLTSAVIAAGRVRLQKVRLQVETSTTHWGRAPYYLSGTRWPLLALDAGLAHMGDLQTHLAEPAQGWDCLRLHSTRRARSVAGRPARVLTAVWAVAVIADKLGHHVLSTRTRSPRSHMRLDRLLGDAGKAMATQRREQGGCERPIELKCSPKWTSDRSLTLP